MAASFIDSKKSVVARYTDALAASRPTGITQPGRETELAGFSTFRSVERSLASSAWATRQMVPTPPRASCQLSAALEN
jgi:hypothetical protein